MVQRTGFCNQGSPMVAHFVRNDGTYFSSSIRNKNGRPERSRRAAFLLLRQGSNLNFSDPESDVLPITPRSSSGCKYKYFQEKEKGLRVLWSKGLIVVVSERFKCNLFSLPVSWHLPSPSLSQQEFHPSSLRHQPPA